MMKNTVASLPINIVVKKYHDMLSFARNAGASSQNLLHCLHNGTGWRAGSVAHLNAWFVQQRAQAVGVPFAPI